MDVVNRPTSPQRNGKANRARTEHHANGRLGKQARKVIRDVQQMSDTAAEIAKDKLGHLKESALDYKDQGRNDVQQFGRTIEEFIQEHPVRTVLIAAGAGLLFGRFWMRR